MALLSIRLADEPELALRRAQPLDAVGGDEHVLLEADVAAAGDGRPELDGEDVPLLDAAERRGPIAVPARAEERPAVVGGAAELVAERVLRLRKAGGDEALPRRRVHLPADRARAELRDPGIDRVPQSPPGAHDLVRRRVLALVEEVPDPLQVAAIVVPRDPEVRVEKLAAPRAQLAGRAVPDLLLGPGVHRGAVLTLPGVAQATVADLRVHERRDLELRQPRPELAVHVLEDLLRRLDRTADAAHLLGRLAPAQGVDDPLGRDESVRVRRPRERLLEVEPEPVRQPVRGWVALRVVERDRARRDAFDGLSKRRAEALVVPDDLVHADLIHARRVVAPNDRDPLSRPRDEERAVPCAVDARHEVEAGITCEERLADERQPQVDVLLAEDLDRLVELLRHERRGGGHARTLAARFCGPGETRRGRTQAAPPVPHRRLTPLLVPAFVLLPIGAAPVLLRLLEQLDLPLQELQLEVDLLLELGLADVALVEASLDDDAGRGQQHLALPAVPRLRLLRDLALLVEEAGLHEVLVDLLQDLLERVGRECLDRAGARRTRARREADRREVPVLLEHTRPSLALGFETVRRRREDCVRHDGHEPARHRWLRADARGCGRVEHAPVDANQLPAHGLA